MVDLTMGISWTRSRSLLRVGAWFIFRLLLILLAERSTPAAKANIQQAEVPHLRLNQVVSHSRLNTRAPCTVLGAADANAIKKAAAKPRGRAQVVLKQTREEKENLPLASPDPDDGINNLFQAAGAQSTPEEDEKEKRQPFMDIVPPNPFLDSDNEYDDLATRKWRENRGKTAEEPDSDQEIFSFDDISSCPTVPDLPDVLDQAVLKSFLHAPTAKKGRHVAWKDKPARYRFYQLPNCNDFWSQIGLKSRPL